MVALRARWVERARQGRSITTLMSVVCIVLGAVVVRHAIGSWQALSNHQAPFGSDFRMNLWGPAILTSEGKNPWLPANSVPRFGIYSPSPVLPASYLLFPVFKWCGLMVTLKLWVTASLVTTVMATRRVARGLGASLHVALALGLLVAISPVSEYNVNLAQFGAVGIAACAVMVPTGPHRRWLHRVERLSYIAMIAVMFGKPTHAATLLLAEWVFQRSMKRSLMAGAALIAMSAVSFAVISARSGISVPDLMHTMFATAHNFADEAGSLGSRTDLLSQWTTSLVFDLSAALAAIVGAKIVSESTRLTLVQRFAVAMCLLTAFSYHHIYDTLPVLVALCALAHSRRDRWRWVLAVTLVAINWLATPPLIGGLVERWLDVRWFDFRSRLVFAVCVMVAAVIVVKARREEGQVVLMSTPLGA
jgi:hypothetical protein